MMFLFWKPDGKWTMYVPSSLSAMTILIPFHYGIEIQFVRTWREYPYQIRPCRQPRLFSSTFDSFVICAGLFPSNFIHFLDELDAGRGIVDVFPAYPAGGLIHLLHKELIPAAFRTTVRMMAGHPWNAFASCTFMGIIYGDNHALIRSLSFLIVLTALQDLLQ